MASYRLFRAGQVVKPNSGRTRFRYLGIALLATVPALVLAQGPGGGGGGTTPITGVSIGPYVLQSSYQVSEYIYNYNFLTSVINSNTAPFLKVLGTVVSSDPNTVVIAGTVEFGALPAAGKAICHTTFTIQQNRQTEFNPSSLSWSFAGSAGTSTVGTAATSVSIALSSASVSYGTGITLTSAVSPAAATGTVTFYDSSTKVGVATITSGTAALTSFVLPTGAHTLSAVYNGDTTYASSTSAVKDATVNAAGAALDCGKMTETARVVCLANAFEATLTADQLSTLQLDYTLANVEHWSNLPLGIVPRNGIQFSTLNSTQLAAALQLAKAALSAEGFMRLQNIRGADDILAAENSNMGWGSGNYFVAFDGTPSTTSPWMLQLNGHHFALNHTFNGVDVSGTPYFLGVEPEVYQSGRNITLAMEKPRSAVYTLTQSVYGNTTALLPGTFDDVVMGVNGKTGIDSNYPQTYPTTNRGVLYSALSTAAQAQVAAMIDAWVTDMDSTTASALLALYEDPTALAQTYVGYSGTGTLAVQGDYLRVDGPRVWIEFCVQNGIAWPASYHFHTIWRDKVADYGADFLSQ